MLACQRDLFDIPRDVAYLNAAAMSPLPRAGAEAGRQGVAGKSRPWTLDRDGLTDVAERTRAAAASLIGATADDIAIIGSTSYGVATASLNLPIQAGTRILILDGEHPSQVLEWQRRASEIGAIVEFIARPSDDDWTSAVLARLADADAAPVSVAALSPSHWTDGTFVDLDRIAPALRLMGAALVVDATQAVGVLPIDVATLQPDFLIFPTYKWTLGPYSLGYLYAAPKHQHGRPLEQHGNSRTPTDFMAGARRYDIGERNNMIGLPIACAGLELVASWGTAAIAERLRDLTDVLASEAAALGIGMPARDRRTPHVLGLRFAGGLPPGIGDRLEAAGVFVSERAGTLRISPHVYNDSADITHFVKALAGAI